MIAIKIEIPEASEKVRRTLEAFPAQSLVAIARAMDQENNRTVSHIQLAYMSFPKDGPSNPIGLRVQTNRLRQSMRATKSVISGQGVSSSIGSNVEYAAAQEFGATIPAHKVTAKGKALAFHIGDRLIFRKSVNIPEITLPARGFTQRGITDRLPAYGESILAGLDKLWGGR